ncbi:MAG: Maf family protein [Deltaproteobacteria bacterium]
MPETDPRQELILASTSETRRDILRALGLRFRVERPDFDETRPPGLTPADLAEALALGKARNVARRFEEALVLGADQVLVCDGELFHKPADAAAARAQLQRLRGKVHHLITGIALLCEKSHALRVQHELTRMTMRMIGDAEVDRYVETGEWNGSVGAYRVEGQGLKLFERIEGDVFNARGLPALRVVTALRELGFPLF